MISSRLTFTDITFAILLWALMIAKYGYTYGTSDHEELLVYVQYLTHPGLYTHDFFVQSLNGSVPNERTVMTLLLLPFEAHLGITIFLAHFLNTVVMILALIRIARLFIADRYASWGAVFLSFFLLYNRALGGVDLYSAAFQTGDLSATIATWGLLYFLEHRYIRASVLVSIASIIHVLVGFDLMVVLCGVMVWRWLLTREVSFIEVARFMGLYVCTAGIYLILVFRAKSAGNGTIPDEELFNIMFLFRHPHHFIFHLFSWGSRLLFLGYTVWALIFYSLRSRIVFQFIMVSLLILVPYVIATDYFHWVLAASFQWYKVTPWVKMFASIAIVSVVYERLPNIMAQYSVWINRGIRVAGVLAGMIMFMLYFHGDIAHGYKQYNDAEIRLSLRLKEIVPQDAVFIQPFEITGLKFYGQRSSYIDFKAIAKTKQDTREWYRRIQEVYGLDYDMPEKGFALESKADRYLNELSENQLAKLKQEGVTHMITTRKRPGTGHRLILQTEGYYVYQL
ncbi:MAG: hypothetical protein JST83_00060 [Bacteroidetes bacterium]|nr:hypothetical protein [Bacteroidota bacterium]